MVLRKIIFLLLVLSISACAAPISSRHGRIDEKDVRTFASIYRQAKQADKTSHGVERSIRLLPDAGSDAPYFPVYESGRVEKVWVPVHVAREDKDVLVAGHWAFVMVEEPHWYIQDHGMDKSEIPVIVPTSPRKE
jgi:hypothetical protein